MKANGASCVMHNVLMAKAFVPAMVEKKQGRVIRHQHRMCNAMLRGAVGICLGGNVAWMAFLRVLAKEIGRHGITVNEVAPGWTLSEESKTTEGTEYIKSVPLKRRGTDQEIAKRSGVSCIGSRFVYHWSVYSGLRRQRDAMHIGFRV